MVYLLVTAGLCRLDVGEYLYFPEKGAHHEKNANAISQIVYSIGIFCVIVLVAVSFWGSGWSLVVDSDFNQTHFSPYFYLDPGARIPVNHIGGFGLAIGTIPMILACVAVYKYNVDKSKHKYRKIGLIFLPAYVCILYTLTLAFSFIVHIELRSM